MNLSVPSVAGVRCHARPLPSARLPRLLASLAALLALLLQVHGLLAEDRLTAQARLDALARPAACREQKLAQADATRLAASAARHCIGAATPYDRAQGDHAKAG